MATNKALTESETERLDLHAHFNVTRDAFMISYLTSTRPGLSAGVTDDDVEIIEQHIQYAQAAGAENIDLFLLTYGGMTVMSWDLIAMIRDYFPKGRLGVFVPGAAFSAGTKICLAADEVILGPSSQLGPVDSTSGWYGYSWQGRNSMTALKGFLDLIASTGVSKRTAQEQMIDWMTAHTDALSLGATYRMMMECERLLDNILSSRLTPPSAAEKKKISDFFLYGVGIHSQSIRRKEAQRNGLNTITEIENIGLAAQVSTLFNHYADIMKLKSPFARLDIDDGRVGDATDFDAFGEHASETPVVIVESMYETNAAYRSYGQTHWREVPPVPENPYKTSPQQPETHPTYSLNWRKERNR